MIGFRKIATTKKELENASKLLLFNQTILTLIDYVYGAVYVVLMNYRGLSAFDISMILAASSLSLFIFDFPSGVISDKFGRKRVAGIGIIVWGTSFFLFLLANNFIGFLIATIVLQLGVALVSGNFETWMYDLSVKYKDNEYRIKFFMKMGTFIQMFSIIGSLLGSMIMVLGINNLYAFCGIITILSGIVCLRFSEDNYSEESSLNSVFKQLIASSKSFLIDKVMRKVIIYEIFNSFVCLHLY